MPLYATNIQKHSKIIPSKLQAAKPYHRTASIHDSEQSPRVLLQVLSTDLVLKSEFPLADQPTRRSESAKPDPPLGGSLIRYARRSYMMDSVSTNRAVRALSRGYSPEIGLIGAERERQPECEQRCAVLN